MQLKEHYPLTSHTDLTRVLAYTAEGTISVGQFLAQAQTLAQQFPAGGHILNLCQDRYHFMVGLAASILAGKVSLLPSSHTPDMLRQMQAFAPDLFCLHDLPVDSIDLPRMAYPDNLSCLAVATDNPLLEAQQLVAYVFTSGSTGKPVPHRKTWGKLVLDAQAEARQLGTDKQPFSLVGTVPPQHMYGFESTVLLALQGNCSIWSGRPFYPADIADALAQIPPPRLLVTTPFHLQSLLDAALPVPPLDMLLSATAPLSSALAHTAESTLRAPLYEIYGCTETGQLASRRTTEESTWRLLPDIRLEQEGEQHFASGGHIEVRTALSDVIQLQNDGTFKLLGRQADLINIAGKRTSLGYLNTQLQAIPGVQSGIFFMPDESLGSHITRLCAFVVAPELPARQLLDALRERIDPIFLPRPLVFVDSLPHNATGKLSRDSLQTLLDEHLKSVQTNEPA